jgi:hypothetical protein
MTEEDLLEARADHVEARAIEYVHRAKRMLLGLFGVEAAHDQTVATLNLATAMIQLEAAEIIAAAQKSAPGTDTQERT